MVDDAPSNPRQHAEYDEHPKMFADEPGKFVLAVLLIPIGVGIVWLVWWYITVRCTRLTVGHDRVLLSRGVFNKERMEIELESIRTVQIDQSFVDRVFNCGILKIYTAGDAPELVQPGLPDPARLRASLRT
ncbi:MAG: PH domain-containing protein [Pseudomonadota bacterium]